MNVSLSPDLQQLSKLLPEPVLNVALDDESAEYQGCSFSYCGKKIIFRSAKITPTKVGQFVTFWKRNSSGITTPYDVSDIFDILIIFTKDERVGKYGCFIFPKKDLNRLGLIRGHLEGKRGFRVYPAWAKVDNRQALKTKEQQLSHFITIDQEDGDISSRLCKRE